MVLRRMLLVGQIALPDCLSDAPVKGLCGRAIRAASQGTASFRAERGISLLVQAPEFCPATFFGF
jgi:hypothetical protein